MPARPCLNGACLRIHPDFSRVPQHIVWFSPRQVVHHHRRGALGALGRGKEMAGRAVGWLLRDQGMPDGCPDGITAGSGRAGGPLNNSAPPPERVGGWIWRSSALSLTHGVVKRTGGFFEIFQRRSVQPQSVSPQLQSASPQPQPVGPRPQSVSPQPQPISPQPQSVGLKPVSTFPHRTGLIFDSESFTRA